MNKGFSKVLFLIMLSALIFAVDCSVFAKVSTENARSEYSDTVYVIGNDNFYPIEFYNAETRQYEGVMPRLLSDISADTGIDFTYIHNDSYTAKELAEINQAAIVSAYITDGNDKYIQADVAVFSCMYEHKSINIGWGFTGAASDELVIMMKQRADKLSQEEINGYLLWGSTDGANSRTQHIPFIMFCSLLLILIIVFIAYQLVKTNKRLKKNKMTDQDTGVGNFLYFENCFNHFVTDQTRTSYYVAYFIIDSGHLQTYYGEAIFHDAIQFTASVLNTYDCESDFVARITENGFAFAYQRKSDHEADTVIELITAKLNSYIEETKSDKHPYFYVANYSLEDTDTNCDLLLFNLRKNCTGIMGTYEQLITCSTTMMNKSAEEKRLVESILSGLKMDEFKLYLQFIVDNKTGKIVSSEALSRWENPTMGVAAPNKYIPVLQRTGDIALLDYHMFELCCIQLHKWRHTELDKLTLSCNFTRITLSETDFIEKISDIAKRYVFDKSKLIIEITEDSIEQNFEQATDNINRCKALGYKIALDDMGTGYTSLLNLCDYPIDILKIDRDILLKTNTEKGKGLFIGIIALAHSLALKVICEGVETEENKMLVSATECDMVQGFYYSRPLPSREGENFARQQI